MINKLFIQKMLVAFLVAFFGAFVTAVEGLSKQPDFSWSKSVLIGLVVGALGAGFRAVLALSPVNVVPSDSQHTVKLGRASGQSGQVDILVLIVLLVILLAVFGGIFWSPWALILLLVILLLLFRR